MIFFAANISDIFEEEEEEETEGDIDDALLGELADDVVEEDELLEAELDPLLKSNLVDPLEMPEEDDLLKEDGVKVFEDDEEEEVDDYDSFDDEDEM